jgi:hypothetical protein
MPPSAATSPPSSDSDSRPDRLGNHPFCRHPPRSRTLVMPFRSAPFYRFFLPLGRDSSHASASFSASFFASFPKSARTQDAPLEACLGVLGPRLCRWSDGLVLARLGGYFWDLAQLRHCDLLLCLRRGPRSRRLRQDVRIKKVRFPVVGHQLR